jgi:hypothetical protein
MYKTIKITVLAAMCMVVPLAAEAKISPSGTSGIINTPSAFVRRPGHISIGYDMTKEDKILHGNLALPLGLEVAGAQVDPKHDNNYSMVSAKWNVLPSTPATPAIAIGGDDLGNEKDRRGYVVASMALPMGFKIHAGVGTDQYKHGFGALEKDFKIGSQALTLMGEYDGSHFNYGASLPLAKFTTAEIGVRSHHLYGSLNFTF